MDNRLRVIGNLYFGWQVLAAGYEYGYMIVTDGPSMIANFCVHPSVYFGFTIIGLAALAWLNWSLVRLLLPSARLRELAQESRRILSSLEEENRFPIEKKFASQSTKADILVLLQKLRKKNIPCPNLIDMNGWYELLPMLIGFLERGKLDQARGCWSAVQSERRTQ